MKKVIVIETDACLSCIGLTQELNALKLERNDFDLEVINQKEKARELVKTYNIEQLPTVLLFSNNVLLGKLHGFQPSFILDVWMETLLEKEKENN